ncbi:hypothetical protein COU76_01315 [Candidatus Peregrinibacteria bacterium CG10_big_fil_rev_8_21_14_0_10_49_10]|nr:MAG: hypothetical protein COU76_01315 [Candidatus Peregrinibacteria bacterium CG10_big_fil_rev_8_21_14_0_10_49_10]
MSNPFFIVAIAGAIGLFFVGFVFLRLRGRKLSGSVQKKLLAQWKSLEQIQDDLRRVLEADSILDSALGASGYSGSLAEKLKKAGPRFSDLNAVWAAHKLRNRIAHEPGMRVSKQESDRAVTALRRAFQDLC